MKLTAPNIHYTWIRKIGAGGMGEIHLMLKKGLTRSFVVLKMLHPSLIHNKNALNMFKAEGEIMALLSMMHHPNIVQMYQMFKNVRSYYIEMEYLPGHNLKEIIRAVQKQTAETPVMPIEYITAIGLQTCYALEYVHEFILAHRDIKPSNIIVTRCGEVKLIDFGVAKIHDETRSLKGTIEYMSPEQMEKGRVDARSDIYSLGMIFYELLTGQKPNRFLPKSLSVRTIPKQFSRIVAKMLATRPQDRYQSARELHLELQAFQELYLHKKNRIADRHHLANFIQHLEQCGALELPAILLNASGDDQGQGEFEEPDTELPSQGGLDSSLLESSLPARYPQIDLTPAP